MGIKNGVFYCPGLIRWENSGSNMLIHSRSVGFTIGFMSIDKRKTMVFTIGLL